MLAFKLHANCILVMTVASEITLFIDSFIMLEVN
jgi:hypothetical protein